MNIAYFTDTFLPTLNGVVVSLSTVSEALGEKGHNIAIYAPKPEKAVKSTWKVKNVALFYIRSLPSFVYPDLRAAAPMSPKLLMQLRSLKPDIIHFQTTFLVGGGGIILGKILRKPVIGSFHTNFMEPEYLRIANIPQQMDMISSVLWRYAVLFFNQCDAILTYSEGAKRELRKQHVSKPIYVIPNTINENKIAKVSESDLVLLREKYQLRKKVFIYVGRISPEKSIDILLKSFSLVVKEDPDVSLLIIGDGPKMQECVKLNKELGITGNVVFTGRIEQAELLTKGYYQLAWAFVTASSSEVQPVSLIEALYFGLPILGVAKRGVEEMVKGVGMLSTPGYAKGLAKNMLIVLRDEKLRETLCKKSEKEYESKYKRERIVKKYEEFYEDVLSKNKKSFFKNIFKGEK